MHKQLRTIEPRRVPWVVAAMLLTALLALTHEERSAGQGEERLRLDLPAARVHLHPPLTAAGPARSATRGSPAE